MIKLYTSETTSLLDTSFEFMMVFTLSIIIGFTIGVISAYVWL